MIERFAITQFKRMNFFGQLFRLKVNRIVHFLLYLTSFISFRAAMSSLFQCGTHILWQIALEDDVIFMILILMECFWSLKAMLGEIGIFRDFHGLQLKLIVDLKTSKSIRISVFIRAEDTIAIEVALRLHFPLAAFAKCVKQEHFSST